jgi:hypothetical protein
LLVGTSWREVLLQLRCLGAELLDVALGQFGLRALIAHVE